ncbi:N-formylglutamate amidohydrolase [Erythrobacter sp.]|jgi:N-formylglutamate amidohydrolase|uniref:N-formylglutamate amidohydrolase n=1 Tax=Erythrobacter sp. TaxID=1042 RepID=UPI002EABB897|nr:N-formylglutamate amidohydrolase [Erythrobacter sp.]
MTRPASSRPANPPQGPETAAARRSPSPDDGASIQGGRVSAECGEAAFTMAVPARSPLPVLIAVPHAGRAYPRAVLDEMRDPLLSQLRLEDRHVDALGREVARLTGTGLLVAHAPRAMIDLNRSQRDVDWDMVASGGEGEGRLSRRERLTGPGARARSGLGIVPRRLPGFGEIWRRPLPRAELERRIEDIHRPYHTALGEELARIREGWGAALLIDLHSMPPLRRQPSEERSPRIVIGDRFGASCHASIASAALAHLEHHGYPAAHNRPYAGGYVLDRHSRPADGFHAVQLEVCRSAYLDAGFNEPTRGLGPLARMLAGLVRVLGAQAAGLGAGGEMPQAAE